LATAYLKPAGLAPNGKSALLAQKIWEEISRRAGCSETRSSSSITTTRPTRPRCPAFTPSCRRRQGRLIIGGYGTTCWRRGCRSSCREEDADRTCRLAVNSEFHYPNYSPMIPRPAADAFTKGFFDTAMRIIRSRDSGDRTPPRGVLRQRLRGARVNAKVAGLKVVYDKR